MRVIAAVRNDSPIPVKLERMEVLNTSRDLNDWDLSSREKNEVNIYDGPRPNHDNYKNAKLFYKSYDTDTFEARFTVDFHREPDNTYVISEFHFNGPVKDI